MDGCADVGGCIEGPFLLFEALFKYPRESTAVIIVAGLFASLVHWVTPTPPPPPPKPPITERVKDGIKRKINRYKIERAEEKYFNQQQEQQPEVAPVKSETRWNRAKDWLRDKLNEDYQERHSDD